MGKSGHPLWAMLRKFFELSDGAFLTAEYDRLNPSVDGPRDTYQAMWGSPTPSSARTD